MYYYTNPYRGPFPFTSSYEEVFFGRDSETAELIDLIRKNSLTILFGASGTGKTSLINARLLPQLTREYFKPIYLRINFGNKNESPLEYIQKRIVEELKKWDNNIPDFEPSQTLIDYAAKNVIFNGLIKPVLFFDQFEELFTLGPKNDPAKINEFILELSDLIELRLPDELKNSVSIKNISSFKVVFSLRQDWVGFLDDFNHLIPSVLENRYRLRKFSPAQALDAIRGPAKEEMSEDVAQKIITLIGTPALWQEVDKKSEINKKLSIEVDPFVLSLYCYQLHEEASKQGTEKITSEFIDEHHNSDLIRHYYDEKLKENEDLKIRIENKLLNESGKRLLIPLNSFTQNNLYTKSLIEDIEKRTGILRITGMDNDCNIEIVHDQLAIQIFESKKEREARKLLHEADEKNLEAANLRSLAQKNADQAERANIKAKKDEKRLKLVIWLASLIIISVLITVVYLYNKANLFKEEANLAKIEALKNQKKSEKVFEDSLRNNSVAGLKQIGYLKSDTILRLKDTLQKVQTNNKHLETVVNRISILENKLRADSILLVYKENTILDLKEDIENKKLQIQNLQSKLSITDKPIADNPVIKKDTLANQEPTSPTIEILSASELRRSEVRDNGIFIKFRILKASSAKKLPITVELSYKDMNGGFRSLILKGDDIGFSLGKSTYSCNFSNLKASSLYYYTIRNGGDILCQSVIKVL